VYLIKCYNSFKNYVLNCIAKHKQKSTLTFKCSLDILNPDSPSLKKRYICKIFKLHLKVNLVGRFANERLARSFMQKNNIQQILYIKSDLDIVQKSNSIAKLFELVMQLPDEI
jgi:hypothetical protein